MVFCLYSDIKVLVVSCDFFIAGEKSDLVIYAAAINVMGYGKRVCEMAKTNGPLSTVINREIVGIYSVRDSHYQDIVWGNFLLVISINFFTQKINSTLIR